MASREDQEYSSQAPAPYIGQFLQQGIFPYAQQFLDQQFRNYGEADSSPFTYTGQRVAEFDPREQYGMQLADSAIGSYRPYLGQQSGLLDRAAQATQQGLSGGRTLAESAEQTGRGSIQSFDPNSAQSFYNPYEQDVVNQTMKDVREGLAIGDMGLRDEAVSSGAFGGSRSRMRRGELAADTARGAAEQIGAIRNQGFTQAQERSQSAFEAQQARQAGLASLQSGLAGDVASMGGQAGTGLSNVGSQYGTMANALPALQQQDIASQMGMGGLGRGRNQSLMDLNYQNFVGQYNLPMQTLQNVGALTASLGPMAGGFGYAGGDATTNRSYAPAGVMPASPDYGQIGGGVNQQFAGNGPSIGNTFAGAKSAFGPGTNPPSQSSFGFQTNPTSQMPQNLSPVNPMAQQIQAASGGYLSPGNGNRRYTSGLGSLASRRY